MKIKWKNNSINANKKSKKGIKRIWKYNQPHDNPSSLDNSLKPPGPSPNWVNIFDNKLAQWIIQPLWHYILSRPYMLIFFPIEIHSFYRIKIYLQILHIFRDIKLKSKLFWYFTFLFVVVLVARKCIHFFLEFRHFALFFNILFGFLILVVVLAVHNLLSYLVVHTRDTSLFRST